MKKYLLILGSFLISGMSFSQARLQVIHNAADPAAATVDIYLNDVIALNDFQFRAASAYLNAPSGVPIKISVAPSTSASSAESLQDFNVTLEANKTYVAIANGVVGSGFASNPDGRSIAFDLLITDMAKETAPAGKVDLLVVHGATDAPAVDVQALGIATLVTNARYRDITDYISVDEGVYTLNILANSNKAIVATYKADLSGLGGNSAVVFASGFLDPSANNSGPAFGLYAALPNGTVVALGPGDKARLQVIHNCADPLASSVDVYLDAAILLNDFDFRSATPYIDAPAGSSINIAVAPSTSTSVNDAIADFDLTLTPGRTYVAIASGVVGSGFAANPNSISTAFDLLIKEDARESALDNTKVDFIVVHGSTDAPGVDVVTGGTTLVDNARFRDITNYLSVPDALYQLDVKDESGAVNVASFNADLSGLAGGAAVVFASGFLNPSNNNNGSAFGLFAALPDGSVVEFPAVVTSINKAVSYASLRAYPMPVSENLNIEFNSEGNDNCQVEVIDMLGKVRFVTNYRLSSGSNQVTLDMSNFERGEYMVRLSGDRNVSVIRCSVSQ